MQVRRDIPGFLANRIQHAMMREAIALVDEGFASAADVDAAVRYLLALHLVRRRGLRIVEAQPVQPRDPGLVVACRRRDREYRVEPTAAEVAASAEVAERLSTLLWSGEAA